MLRYAKKKQTVITLILLKKAVTEKQNKIREFHPSGSAEGGAQLAMMGSARVRYIS
ncbi:MAG TPA: hypothetical protein VGL41_01370 [Roseiarcus sp.]